MSLLNKKCQFIYFIRTIILAFPNPVGNKKEFLFSWIEWTCLLSLYSSSAVASLCLHLFPPLTLTPTVRICPHQLHYMISGIISPQHLALVTDVIIRSLWRRWGQPRNDKGALAKHHNHIVQTGSTNKITVFLEEVSLRRLGWGSVCCSKSLGFCGWEVEDEHDLGG